MTMPRNPFRRLQLAGLLLAGAAIAPLPALAGEGMPQLDFANPLTIWQVIWMAVIFLLLYLLVRLWGLPQVANVVDARNASILSDLETARQAKERADAAVTELTVVTRKAHADAQAQIAAALDKAKAEAAAQSEAANARLDAQLEAAEGRIAAARNAAMAALRDVASETARNMMDRLLGEAQATQVDNAVGRALAGRGQA